MFMKPKAALLPMWAVASLQMLLVLTPAQAQSPTTAAVTRPDPADPKALHPAASYSSSLRAYQRFAEPAVAPWRETNDLVQHRGGWRAYARDANDPGAAQPAAPGASQPTNAPRPTTGGHSGHEMR